MPRHILDVSLILDRSRVHQQALGCLILLTYNNYEMADTEKETWRGGSDPWSRLPEDRAWASAQFPGGWRRMIRSAEVPARGWFGCWRALQSKLLADDRIKDWGACGTPGVVLITMPKSGLSAPRVALTGWIWGSFRIRDYRVLRILRKPCYWEGEGNFLSCGSRSLRLIAHLVRDLELPKT